MRAIHFIAPEHVFHLGPIPTVTGYPDIQRRTGTPTVRGELPVRSRGEIATPESVASLYRAAQGKSSRIPQVWDLPRQGHPSISGKPRQADGSGRQKKEAVRAGCLLSAVRAVPSLTGFPPAPALCRPAPAISGVVPPDPGRVPAGGSRSLAGGTTDPAAITPALADIRRVSCKARPYAALAVVDMASHTHRTRVQQARSSIVLPSGRR